MHKYAPIRCGEITLQFSNGRHGLIKLIPDWLVRYYYLISWLFVAMHLDLQSFNESVIASGIAIDLSYA